jgi:hypothetical protein
MPRACDLLRDGEQLFLRELHGAVGQLEEL